MITNLLSERCAALIVEEVHFLNEWILPAFRVGDISALYLSDETRRLILGAVKN